MSVSLPNGIIFSIAKTMAAAVDVTDIANGADPALTSASTFAEDDIILLISGWQAINETPFKVGATNKILGVDTTDVQTYPANGGAGRAMKVETWQQIQQVLTSDTSGGDMQFVNYSFLENDYESQIPTESTPVVLTLSIADDDSLPGYQELKKASKEKQPRILRGVLPNGAELYYYAYASLNETPTMTKGQVMAVTATFSLTSKPMRYVKK